MTKTPRTILVELDTPLPPPRPGVRYVRVLRVGVVVSDDHLRRRVARFFHWPMIVLALLILPLLCIELFYLRPHPELKGSALDWACAVGFIVIWFAFLVEFIIKIAIAECRVEYVKRNWLDLIIIAAPMLRPLRLGSLAKTSRVFTVRGVGMEFLRYVFTILIGMEATERLLERIGIEDGKGRREARRMTRFQLIDEVKALRRKVDRWEAWNEAHDDWLQAHGIDPEEVPLAPDERGHDDGDGDTVDGAVVKPCGDVDRRRPRREDTGEEPISTASSP